MSDNLRQDRAIRDALRQGYPGQPQGQRARHVVTRAALIRGMVASKSAQLPTIAAPVPHGTTPESRGKRFARWLENAPMTAPGYCIPYAEGLLTHLALQPLVLVMDGRVVGRGCVALRLHGVSKGRALPLAWQGRQGQQGHLPEAMPIALVEQGQAWLPRGASVVLLGEGAFDGTGLQHTLAEAGWSSVCRPGGHMTASWQGETCRLDTLGTCLKPGRRVAFSEARFPAAAYGPLLLICGGAKGYHAPLYLVTTMTGAEEAWRVYAQRFRSETFFSAQKSRGFQLQKAPIADATRLARLLIAVCLAYLWIVYLGALGTQNSWSNLIHRGDRGDLRLFQLGWRLLDSLLNEGFTIPVAFSISIETL